jgi:voltage-dependent potassium channel beta subunit
MEYRRLGRSGLKLGALSYGSWVTFGYQVDERAASELMKTAYDAGVNFFDNAEVYADGQSERIMGAALRKLGWSRDSYCVSSKAYWGGELPTQRGLSRKHLHDACHAALERLGLDYLDLFFCHRPDLDTPIEETVRAMHDLIAQGKVLYWGTSEWEAEQIQQAHGVARARNLVPPSAEQPEYNMFHRQRVEREYHRLYDEIGLGLTTWSPLACGILTGKYSRGVPADSRMALADYAWLRERIDSDEGRGEVARADTLATVAREAGMSRAQLAIAWCLKNPRVSTVILGARTDEQLRENLASLDKLPALTPEVVERVEAVLGNRPPPPRRW